MTTDSGKKPFNTDRIKEVIREWKFAWMDIKGTDERDRENYLRRAFGVDANMMHNLATRIESAFGPCPNCERLEWELFVEKDAAKKLEIHTTVVRQKMKEEIQRLQKQLEMCKNTLIFISKTDVSENSPDLLWLVNWRNTRKEMARECLTKLEGAE